VDRSAYGHSITRDDLNRTRLRQPIVLVREADNGSVSAFNGLASRQKSGSDSLADGAVHDQQADCGGERKRRGYKEHDGQAGDGDAEPPG
jgi:hypothetical protein